MIPGIIAISVFALVIIVAKLTRRGEASWLDALPMLPGEEEILVDETARWRAYMRGNSTSYKQSYRARIVVTNKRVIFSQRAFPGKHYFVTYTLNYVDSGPPLTPGFFVGGGLWQGGGFLKQVHLDFFVPRDHITFPLQKGKEIVKLTIPFPNHGPLFGEPWIEIETERVGEYKNILMIK